MVNVYTIILVSLLLSGCAFTSVYDENIIVLRDTDGNEFKGNWDSQSGIRIYIRCSSYGYTAMLSPIIPLPPIIPVMGLGGSSSTDINIFTDEPKKLIVDSVKVAGLDNRPNIFKTNSYQSNANYSIESTCEEMVGGTLEVNIAEPEKLKVSFSIIEINSNLKLGVEYLGD